MAKLRMVNTKFWSDNYISELDPVEKLLFLYLITNSHTDICGLYEIPIKTIAVETGIEKEMVLKILKRFEEDGKIYYINGWVGIKNFIKHQIKNPKVNRGIQIGLNNANKELLDRLCIDYDSLSHSNSNSNSNSNNTTADKSAGYLLNNKPISMEELTYEYEDSGKTPKKYSNKRKLYSRIAIYYMGLQGETGNVLRYFKDIKELVEIAEGQYPEFNEEKIEAEIKGRINKWRDDQLKKDLSWGLSGVITHWNRILKS